MSSVKTKNQQRDKNIARNMLAYLRSWDQFGHPVGLSIDGESEYKTLYGSIATLILIIYMAYVSVLAFEPITS